MFFIIYLFTSKNSLKTANDELWGEVKFCARFHNSVGLYPNHILVEF